MAKGYVEIEFMVRWPFERVWAYGWPLGGDRYRIECPHPLLRGTFRFLKELEKHVNHLSLRRIPKEGDVVSCWRDQFGHLHFRSYQD